MSNTRKSAGFRNGRLGNERFPVPEVPDASSRECVSSIGEAGARRYPAFMRDLATPLLVLTGAGVSQESGVPTFRGVEGLWRQYRPEDLATPEAFARDPRLVWDWYDWRRGQIAACRPNPAHDALVAMERDLPAEAFLLVTQNVDGLHELAGSRALLLLHGSIWELHCTSCAFRTVNRQVPLAPLPPPCPRCGAWLRPGVVWFGESLDDEVLDRAVRAAETARTVLVIGTSGLVYPAAALPEIARRKGARIVEVNPEETPLSAHADQRLAGPAALLVPDWWSAVRGQE